MTVGYFKCAVALLGGALGVSVSGSALAAFSTCQLATDHACWNQITFTNFKDVAVGNNIVCMVGGNVQPTAGSDAYLHPNAHSDNQGNEDVIECHRPQGVWGYEARPIYPGYGTDPNTQNRVPQGIYDDGVWQGTPTGVITLYGAGGDDIAVLNSQQYTYVSAGASQNAWSGGNYSTYTLDRKNIDASTGATICLKGLFSQILPITPGDFQLYAIGCNGQTYFANTNVYAGWTLTNTTVYNEVAGGWGLFYGLKPGNQVYLQAYHTFLTMGPMPSGDIPAHVGVGYVSASSNRIYTPTGAAAWQLLDISYPAASDPTSALGRIEDGSRFRCPAPQASCSNTGEIFVWQSFGRVYNYKM